MVAPGRIARAAGRRLRAPGVRLGLLRYHPMGGVASERRYYESGSYEYFVDLEELPRYSITAGYIQWLGGEPAIADLGCGYGLLRRRLEGLDFERYVGIDAVPQVIERAAELSDERTSFVVGEATSALRSGELERGGFDICVMLDVLYVADDPPSLIEAARELLRPGGHLLCCNYRHPGDAGLSRLLDERFTPVDAVEVRSLTRRGWRGRRWRMSCHCRDD